MRVGTITKSTLAVIDGGGPLRLVKSTTKQQFSTRTVLFQSKFRLSAIINSSSNLTKNSTQLKQDLFH
jgi:hypothetical protein